MRLDEMRREPLAPKQLLEAKTGSVELALTEFPIGSASIHGAYFNPRLQIGEYPFRFFFMLLEATVHRQGRLHRYRPDSMQISSPLDNQGGCKPRATSPLLCRLPF